ncbi:AI-2E family transporter [Shewanella sp. C32]|uniref:AI-2E family transporter n=1 Tax=Shewanella electrica TaxID=515560 RepID=A0ABT2FH29_9GAMM|nr:AI-2E family transporter [Shewanella electrica]MCH1923547.1 AI-2E family transporter [Shewanella electrica]MCS4555644.1 AI-2E family transporter [Shewanella electrica]
MTSSYRPSMTVRSFAVMAFLVIVLAGIKAASAIVVPFVLSVFIAMICSPLISTFVRYRCPRWLAVLAMMGLILLAGLWIASIVGSSINDFTKNLPEYRSQLVDQFSWILDKLRQFNIRISKDQVLAYFDPGMALSMTTNTLSGVGNVMANLFLIILTIVFMLFEAESLPRKLHLALDKPDMRMSQIDRFMKSVNRYMVIKTLVSLATGAIAGIGLWLMGVDYPLLWGVVAFLFNYIPNIGSVIAALPPVLLAFVQFGPSGAGGVAILYVGINTVMGNVVEPRFMGRGLGLSTLVVFLSLIFWGWLLGSVGMLLSVPLTMVVKIALENNAQSRKFAILLADDSSAQEIHDRANGQTDDDESVKAVEHKQGENE